MKYLISALLVLSLNAIASESKIVCGHEKDANSNEPSVLWDVEQKAIKDINSKIKLAESEGFVRVSAPMGVNSYGYTHSFCVTVTKP